MNILPVALALFLATPQAPFQESIEVRLHNIDVVVTNDKGEPVTGLGVEDFVLLEDGKPQAVTNFSAYAETRAAANPTETAFPEPSPAPGESFVAPAGAATPPPRSLVFFIDEMRLHPATLEDLSANIRQFVMQMRQGDVAAVVRPMVATSMDLQFTSDRAQVAAKIAEALSENSVTGKRVGFENDVYWFRRDMAMAGSSPEAKRSVARRWAARTRQRVRQRLGTMRAIVTAMASREGRKALIAVTQSLQGTPGREFFYSLERYDTGSESLDAALPASMAAPAPPSDPRTAGPEHVTERGKDLINIEDAFQQVARLASSNGVTLYVIRPEHDILLMDVVPDLTANSASSANPSPPDFTMMSMMQSAIANTTLGVTPLVDITGGRQFRPSEAFDDVMRQIATDFGNYYSLAYHAQGGLDEAHRVEVRVRNRPALRVRARSEVERKSAPHDMTDLVVASLIRKAPANDLGIAVRCALKRSKAKTDLQIDILIPFASLDFERVGNVYRARYSAHYAITGTVNDFASGVDLDRSIEVPARDWEKVRRRHWTHSITVHGSVQKYRVAVGVMDVRNQRSGFATIDVRQ